MNTFDGLLNNVLQSQLIRESVVDIPRDSLDSTVFQFFNDGRPPILKDGIKSQILRDVDSIGHIAQIDTFYGIGSIFTQNYTSNCDIDITIQINVNDLESVSAADLLAMIKKLNGKLAVGSTHPINYYCITSEYDWDKAEAVYDIPNERWLKIPEVLEPDIGSYIVKFQETLQSIDLTTGELRRNLIDFSDIRKMKIKNVLQLKHMLHKKLKAIEENIKQLTTVYQHLKIMRQMAFNRAMTPQEIQIYGSKNMLPENIIYKLMEKYYYIKFLKKLDELITNHDEVELFDIPTISKISKAFWTT